MTKEAKLKRAAFVTAVGIFICLSLSGGVALAQEDMAPVDDAGGITAAEAPSEDEVPGADAEGDSDGEHTLAALYGDADTTKAGETATTAGPEEAEGTEPAEPEGEGDVQVEPADGIANGESDSRASQAADAEGIQLADTGLIASAKSSPDSGSAAPSASAVASSAPAAAKAAPGAGGAQAKDVSYQAMYRCYNPNSGEHFYTADSYERDHIVSLGWRYEGIGWLASGGPSLPVFRLYNPNAGDHHYTLSTEERDHLISVGWRYEGIGWHSDQSEIVPLYRQYNPNAVSGAHNFTESKEESDHLVSLGWRYEGISWYGLRFFLSNVVAGTSDGAPDQETSVLEKNHAYYAFLPSYADETISLGAKDAQGNPLAVYVGSGSHLARADRGFVDLTSVGVRDSDGTYSVPVRFGASSSPLTLKVMKSANVRAIFLTSKDAGAMGRAYVEASPNHTAKADVVVVVVDPDGSVDYDKDNAKKSKYSTVKGRGNSTWGLGDKKPYQVSLNKKADLLETGDKDNAQKKWVLLANAGDATLLHNQVALDFARELGMRGIECAPVDLYYDGEYRGSYLLTEKVEVKPGRVDIEDLEGATEDANDGTDLSTLPLASGTNSYGREFHYVSGVDDSKDITGGYLIERDSAYYKDERTWFDTSVGKFVVKSPESASKAEATYVSEAFQRALDNANGGRFNLSGDFSFDLDTLSKNYLANDLFKNIDAFASSTYFYLDSGSKTFYCEPVWDFDTSTGTRTDYPDKRFSRYAGHDLVNAAWVAKWQPVQQRVAQLWQSDTVRSAVAVLNGGVSAKTSDGTLHSVRYYAQQVSASQRMNEVVYGVTSFRNCVRPFATWQQNVDYMESWLANRTAWLDGDRYATVGQQDKAYAYRGFDYGMVYDCDYYLEKNPDVRAAFGGDPARTLQHFVEFGMAEGRTSCRNFNVQAYRARYADLRAAFGGDLRKYYEHYCQYGFGEARLAS